MKKLFPIGYKSQNEIAWTITLYLIALVPNMNLLYKLFAEKQAFIKMSYPYYHDSKVLRDYSSLCDGSQAIFILLIIYCIAIIYAHYKYHSKGSKSIYTMKRLKNANELHFRCISFPAIVIILSIISAISLIFINYHVYMSIMPQNAIQAGQLEKLLSAMTRLDFYMPW